MRVVAEVASLSVVGGYRFAMQTNRNSGEFRYALLSRSEHLFSAESELKRSFLAAYIIDFLPNGITTISRDRDARNCMFTKP